MQAQIRRVADHLTLIVLSPPISGFEEFIGVWLYRNRLSVLVDVGPAATAPQLLQALQRLGIRHLDYILITHIHIDHVGALAVVARRFSDTPIVCHSKGIPHLVDPTRLQEGSLKTLGDIGHAYGPIEPVPEQRFLPAEPFNHDTIKAICTPGHSQHHFSYHMMPYLFAGEAGGVCYDSPGGGVYLRPATPPKFIIATAVESIERLMRAISNEPHEQICYGHLGVRSDARRWLDKHRQQLFDWDQMIRNVLVQGDRQEMIDSILAKLLASDPLLAEFNTFPPEIRERERFFLRNSIRGFVQSY